MSPSDGEDWLRRVAGKETSAIEAQLLLSENQFNNTVIILGSEAVRMGLEKLDTSDFGLCAGEVKPDHFSPNLRRARVEIALSGDNANLSGIDRSCVHVPRPPGAHC